MAVIQDEQWAKNWGISTSSSSNAIKDEEWARNWGIKLPPKVEMPAPVVKSHGASASWGSDEEIANTIAEHQKLPGYNEPLAVETNQGNQEPSWLRVALDYAFNKPSQALYNAVLEENKIKEENMVDGKLIDSFYGWRPENFERTTDAFMRGWRGEERPTGSEFLESEGVTNPTIKNLGGGALDIVLSPGVGPASKIGGKATSKIGNAIARNLARGAITGGIVESGSAAGKGASPGEILERGAEGAALWGGMEAGLPLVGKAIKETPGKVADWLWPEIRGAKAPKTVEAVEMPRPEVSTDSSVEMPVPRSILESPKVEPQNIEMPNPGKMSEPNILEGINPGELKDINPFSTGARDVYRNFKAAFGKYYDLIKSRLLDKFDDAKLANVVYQEDWLKRLNEEVVNRLGITKDSKLSELVQRYGEGGRTYYDPKTNKVVKEPYTLEDLMRDAPNDWEKVVEADEWFRKAYDDIIDQVNAVKKEIYPGALSAMQKIEAKIADLKDPQKWTREAQDQAIHEIEWELKMLRESPRRRSTEDTQLMQSLEEKIKRIKEEPKYDSEYRETKIKALEVELDKAMRRYNVPKRSDYYRHYRELGDTFEGIKNIFDSPANIDPHLEGVSAFTQPKSRWASFMQKRGVGPYKEDAVGGFLNYLEPASYAIHIDPYVSKFANLADDLADATATTGQANEFIRFLREYSQDLAGKTNIIDRVVQNYIPGGRTAIKALNWLNSRIKANSVLGNASSAVAQLANVPQGLAFAKQYSAEGFGRAVKSIFQEDPAMASSGFLKERFSGQMYQEFNTKLLDKPKDFAVWVMNTADKIGTNFIWQSAYAKGVAEKVANPVRFADAETRRLVAGRGIGEVPLVQKSKVFQLMAPFQLEVGNLWHVMKDMVSEKDFGGLAILFVANWMFNRGAEQVRGTPVTFDPIQAMIDAFQEEDTTLLQKAGRLGGEVLSNIPLGQTGASWFDDSTRKKYFGKEDPTRYGVGPLVAKGIQDPLTRLLLPYGGAQVDKTIRGAGALEKGAAYQGDTTVNLLKDWLLGSDDAEMKYPVEPDAVNLIKGLLFGPSGLSETKEYYDNNRRPLSEKQTQAVERSSDPKAAYERIIRQKNIDNLRSKINEVVKDRSLSQEEKKKRVQELQGRLKKVAGGG